MKQIKVRVAGSISEPLQQIQDRIRVRAYEKFLSRGEEANMDLDDWLDAERELLALLTATVTRQKDDIVAEMQLLRFDLKSLLIQVTTEEALVEAVFHGSPEESESQQRIAPAAFGVIRFEQEIDPGGVRAYYGGRLLRLTAPIARAKNLKASA